MGAVIAPVLVVAGYVVPGIPYSVANAFKESFVFLLASLVITGMIVTVLIIVPPYTSLTAVAVAWVVIII